MSEDIDISEVIYWAMTQKLKNGRANDDGSVAFDVEHNLDAIDEFIERLESAKDKIIEALKPEANSPEGCTKERAVDIARDIFRDALN